MRFGVVGRRRRDFVRVGRDGRGSVLLLYFRVDRFGVFVVVVGY